MKIELEHNEKKISVDEILEFEERNDIKLPENYKKLITKFNGGMIVNSDNMDTLLSIKYGSVRVENTIKNHQIIESNIPKDYFPFALDFSNNPITICLKEGSHYGEIVLFYFDVDRVEKIANSLEELFGVTTIDEL